MSYETILFDVDDGVATITFNRPEKLNAFNNTLRQELSDIIETRLTGNRDIRVVIVTGAGSAFCVGTDLRERAAQDIPAARFVSEQRFVQNLFRRFETLEQVTIAAINGFAFGGGTELILTCDLRVASEKARLGLPEVGLGIIPMAGGTQRLPRLIGVARAKELILTAERISAGKALEIGLVSRVVAAEALIPEVRALAGRIARLPPLAVRLAKNVINVGLQADIATSLEVELQTSAILFDTQDRKEGMAAFVEKREPVFRGI